MTLDETFDESQRVKKYRQSSLQAAGEGKQYARARITRGTGALSAHIKIKATSCAIIHHPS
jgi:hypothetical protein